MKNRIVPSLLFTSVALLLAGCESDQGPSPAVAQSATAMGDSRGKEIQPAPETKSYAGKKDVFQGAEYDPGMGNAPAGAKQVQLRVGEVIEVFHGSFALGDGKRELAFYLPAEARSVVQLVVETKGLTRTYFLKAVGQGDTVGGVVERRWLDSAGYNPVDTAAEARIQAAVKAAPYLISVTN
ncbi:MAG TPA: hypothetical protein VKC51_07030 [Lacunisphaera sp.]|nr:hypothetical protein [Lacunisphaera sp.]